jgi:hypothetical protein
MISTGWNPWKITAIGLGLVTTIALIIGVGVANWSGREESPKPTKTRVAAVTPAAVAAPSATLPSQAVIDACNQHAAQQAPQGKTTELVKDGAIGAVIGAAVGAAGGAIVDGGSGAGKGAVIGGVLGAGGGALYGVNENRKTDERYGAAYATCMRSRGYAS